VAAFTSGGKRAVAVAGSESPPGSGGDDGKEPEGGEGEGKGDRDRRGVSFRTVAFIGAIIAVVVAVVGTVVFASRNTYSVAFDGNEVTIFRGDPDGLLGDPAVEERTGLQRSDVPASYIDELEDGKEFSSLDDARDYVTQIQQEAAAERNSGGPPGTLSPPTSAPETSGTTNTTSDDGSPPTTADGGEVTTTTDGGLVRG
jgi:hypothetical protein